MNYDDALDRGLDSSQDVDQTGSRYEVPEPVVRQEGSVTVYENFPATVETLDRDPSHALKFFQSELATAATIDEAGRARFTGSFKQKRVADILDDYVSGFVRCSECGLPDTRLVTENGVTVLRCDACGARSPVPEN